MKELPPGWAWTTLGEIAEVGPVTNRAEIGPTTPVSFVPMAAVEAGTGVLDASAIREWQQVSKGYVPFAEGDILFARITPCMENGKVAIARNLTNGVGAGSTEFHVVRPRKSIEPVFLLHYLLQMRIRQDARAVMQGAAGQLRVPATFLKALVTPLPPQAEQRRIVAEMERLCGNVDAALASLRVAQAKLGLYEASTLNRVFQSGYPLARIGDIFDVFVGSTPSRSVPEYWGGGIPWVSSGEVAFCRIVATRETISPLGLASSSVKLHPQGTVLLGMIGEGKTRGQAAILDIEAGHNQNSAAIRVSEAGYPPEYLFWFLFSEYERTRSIGSGNNQPALNKSRVENMLFPFPPLPEQVTVVGALEKRMSLTASLRRQVLEALRRAATLRQAILKKAFEGKLVPQDPNDEPASVLLDHIRAARAHAPARRAPRKRSPEACA